MNRKILLLPALILLSGIFWPSAHAGIVTFTVDPVRSSISFSGSVTVPHLGTYPLQPQGTGGLTSAYTGQLLVDLEPPNIIFPGGSAIAVQTNGIWQPGLGGSAGSAPACYAGKITPPLTTGYFAARDLQFDLTGSGTRTGSGSFVATNMMVTYLTNPSPPRLDFLVSSLVPGQSTNGTTFLAGSQSNAAAATLSNALGTLTLSISVNVTNNSTNGSGSTLSVLNGRIVATAPAAAWPLQVTAWVQSNALFLSWPSLPGQSFTVQTAADPGGPWTGAAGKTTSSGATTVWSASSLPGGNVQYFRVRGAF
jgi:hypothetical protein